MGLGRAREDSRNATLDCEKHVPFCVPESSEEKGTFHCSELSNHNGELKEDKVMRGRNDWRGGWIGLIIVNKWTQCQKGSI